MVDNKRVFVLLGPSGVGKTTVGKSIEQSNDDAMFLSTGEELWEAGVLQPWTKPDTDLIKHHCRDIIKNIFNEFASSTEHRVLILDCVKDLEDAEFVTGEAERHNLTISRALPLFNTNVDAWAHRDATRLGLRKPGSDYSKRWLENFAVVQNYYRQRNELAPPQEISQLSEIVTDRDQVKFSARPNYLQFLLLDSAQSKMVYNKLLSILRLSRFEFSVPVSLIHCARDAAWVADPSRYHVTRKGEGVRFLLLKVKYGSYLINVNRQVFLCDIDVEGIPNDTILDGELLPSISFSDIDPSIDASLETSVFLACDILAVSNQIKWTLPFSMRLEVLNKLNIPEDVTAVIGRAGFPGNDFYPISMETPLPIYIALKRQQPSSPAEIQSCLQDPITGLVFTPEMPYQLGKNSLGFQWLPDNLIRCSMSTKALKYGSRPCNPLWFDGVDHFVADQVTECQWDSNNNEWRVLFHNPDKTTPDSEEMIDHFEKMGQQPYGEWQLQTAIQIQRKVLPSFESSNYDVLHPSLTYTFEELYLLLKRESDSGRVRKSKDSLTGLEVFNRICPVSEQEPITQLCQGLVVHPESKKVVTMPFSQFVADLPGTSDDKVEATMNFDGLFGVAFLWNDEVKGDGIT